MGLPRCWVRPGRLTRSSWRPGTGRWWAAARVSAHRKVAWPATQLQHCIESDFEFWRRGSEPGNAPRRWDVGACQTPSCAGLSGAGSSAGRLARTPPRASRAWGVCYRPPPTSAIHELGVHTPCPIYISKYTGPLMTNRADQTTSGLMFTVHGGTCAELWVSLIPAPMRRSPMGKPPVHLNRAPRATTRVPLLRTCATHS